MIVRKRKLQPSLRGVFCRSNLTLAYKEIASLRNARKDEYFLDSRD